MIFEIKEFEPLFSSERSTSSFPSLVKKNFFEGKLILVFRKT